MRAHSWVPRSPDGIIEEVKILHSTDAHLATYSQGHQARKRGVEQPFQTTDARGLRGIVCNQGTTRLQNKDLPIRNL